MALFGSRYRHVQPATAMTAELPPQGAPTFAPKRQRSMWGRLGAMVTPERIATVGAALRDDPGVLQAVLAAQRDERARRDMFGFQVRRAKIEEGQAQDEAAALEAAIAHLPADQQATARLNPEAFAEAQMRRQTGSDWQHGQGYSHAFRVNPDGTVTMGDALPQRPRENIYQPPAGYRGTPDRLEVIPGGPRDATARTPTFGPDQRARVAITYQSAADAVRQLAQMEAGGYNLDQDWGAAGLDALMGRGEDGNVNAIARRWGGEDFQQYVSASSAFEAAMLPILSGAAVTESESRRIIRAVLPQQGDGPTVRRDKVRRRQQMLNGAALIGGMAPPYPELGVPDWAQRYASAHSAASATEDQVIPDGISAEEWNAMTPEERMLFQ